MSNISRHMSNIYNDNMPLQNEFILLPKCDTLKKNGFEKYLKGDEQLKTETINDDEVCLKPNREEAENKY